MAQKYEKPVGGVVDHMKDPKHPEEQSAHGTQVR